MNQDLALNFRCTVLRVAEDTSVTFKSILNLQYWQQKQHNFKLYVK